MFGQIQSEDLLARGFLSRFLQHLTFRELREAVPDSDQLFSFSFVRNPWDRMVSVYSKTELSLHQQARSRGFELGKLTFPEFVRRCEEFEHIHLLEQHRFLCDDSGQPAVDFVGRFENLQRDFQQVCQRLHVRLDLPHLGQSPARRPYRSYYDADTHDRVARRYQRDIEIFGYDF